MPGPACSSQCEHRVPRCFPSIIAACCTPGRRSAGFTRCPRIPAGRLCPTTKTRAPLAFEILEKGVHLITRQLAKHLHQIGERAAITRIIANVFEQQFLVCLAIEATLPRVRSSARRAYSARDSRNRRPRPRPTRSTIPASTRASSLRHQPPKPGDQFAASLPDRISHAGNDRRSRARLRPRALLPCQTAGSRSAVRPTRRGRHRRACSTRRRRD